MDMKNYEENTDSKKKITFLFSPAVQAFKFKPPLLILLSENEKMTVNNVKKVILRSLDKPELGLKRVSLSTISKDKHYHLLLENCNISGMKVLNKFIYAFEISYSDKSYTCLMCNYKYVDELKLHKDCKGFVILCDKCIAFHESNHIPIECRNCYKKETTLESFIKISKSASVMSILNISVSICEDSSKERQIRNPRIFKLTFENDTKDSKDISVHIIDTQDHQCSDSCYYDNKATPENNFARKRLLSFFNTPDSSDKNDSIENNDKNTAIETSDLQLDSCQLIPKVQPENTVNKNDTNFDEIMSNSLEIPLQQLHVSETNSLPKFQNNFDKLNISSDENENIVLEKSNLPICSSQLEQKSNEEICKFEINAFNYFNERTKVLDSILEKLQEIEEMATNCKSRNDLQMNTLDYLNDRTKTLDTVLEKLQEFEEMKTNCKLSHLKREFKPFENLKFSGKNDTKHPVRFVEDFDFIATQEKLNDYEKQQFFGQSLIKEAAEWFKIHGYGESYENMKQSFLNFFWSKQDQNRFISFLKSGKYNEKSKLSKFVYFYKYINEAKFLDVAPDEDLLIYWLVEHFDVFVRTKLYGSNARTIDEILQILKDLESQDINYNTKSKSAFNLFSSSSAMKSRNGTWTDCLNNKYDILKKENQTFYRCLTTRIWPMHTLSHNNSLSNIKYFNVTCDESDSHFLTDIPEKLYCIFTDIKESPRDYEVLGPITIAKQNGRQLIVSTCPSFKTHRKLTAGQLLYFMDEHSFEPCGIITCSIQEDSEYRYVISNNNEQIVSLLCKETIDEVDFYENRTVAVTDLIVRYFEQKFFNRRHILRFLNESFCTIYTVWDKAIEIYDPLKPTYH